MSEDRVTHGALVDQPVEGAGTVQMTGRDEQSPTSPCPWPTLAPVSLGLLREEARMLGVEMGMGTGCRLEGHGADGALVENFAV